MKKQMINAAMAVLISLGISACSISTGGGSQGEAMPRTTSSSLSKSSNTVENQADDSVQDNTGAETKEVETDTQNQQENIKDESQTSSYAVTTTQGLQGEKYRSNLAAQEQLLATIKTMNNVIVGSCNNTAGFACNARSGTTVKEGDVMLAYKQSYSNYAVVRENYDANNGVAPVNSFVAIATEPTTDKTAVVDATYKGQVSWSSSLRPAVRTVGTLVMNVTNSKISGVVTEASGTGNTYTLIDFNSADIAMKNGSVGFDGTAKFYKRAFSQDLDGTYQGYFAGSKAEEVVGTFQSNTISSDAAVQGVFAGKK